MVILCDSTPAQLPRSDFPACLPRAELSSLLQHPKIKEGREGAQCSLEAAAVLGTEEKHLRVQRLKSTSNALGIAEMLSALKGYE